VPEAMTTGQRKLRHISACRGMPAEELDALLFAVAFVISDRFSTTPREVYEQAFRQSPDDDRWSCIRAVMHEHGVL
jgi:hypothetical protein